MREVAVRRVCDGLTSGCVGVTGSALAGWLVAGAVKPTATTRAKDMAVGVVGVMPWSVIVDEAACVRAAVDGPQDLLARDRGAASSGISLERRVRDGIRE